MSGMLEMSEMSEMSEIKTKTDLVFDRNAASLVRSKDKAELQVKLSTAMKIWCISLPNTPRGNQ